MNKTHLFYVYGAGLGHLNRVLNFIATENIVLNKCVILTNSNFCSFIPENISVIQKTAIFFKNKKKLNLFLKKSIESYGISNLIIDVFPTGFYGEFEDGFQIFGKIKTILLSRILKDTYFSLYTSPVYDIVYLMEEGINTEHLKGKLFRKYHLKNRVFRKNLESYSSVKKPFFLIIHSSPASEVLLLYKQALLFRTNQHIYIQTYAQLDFDIIKNTTIIYKNNTDQSLLEEAEKIFTGCGFNIISETENYRYKQHTIPFNRKYDNQFKRNTITFNKKA